jgi:metallo-beta-lactamase family protein
MKQLKDDGKNPLRSKQFTIARTVEASKQIAELRGPFIVISASGMATGGRILHHLKRWLPEERATVLLCGFQAYGTRGRALLEGSKDIRIYGKEVPVRAKVDKINGLSAHADRTELLKWSGALQRPPKATYLVHGEPEASQAFANTLTKKKWNAVVAEDRAQVDLR